MLYMSNNWNREEAIDTFGEELGGTIYGIWEYCRKRHLGNLVWYAELDGNCRQKIVDRANAIFTNN